MELNTRYIIDLTHANTPADVVFELSNIIEKPEAANKRIWLKLGDITLNQSQLLSINSLISSINSTLSLIESESQQTELAAATLGISTKDVEEELQEELSALEPESPADKPSEQYIPMIDHIEKSAENKSNDDSHNSSLEIQSAADEQEKPETADASDKVTSYFSDACGIDEKEITKSTSESKNETSASLDEEANFEADAKLENTNEDNESKSEQHNDFITPAAEPMSEEKEEEIQEQLDSIFDSEAKLENILSEEKELSDMKNWPMTKEADDFFEIPDEEMTDEDYEILQMNTQYHKQTVRSGQVIKSNGNVVIIGDCHPGCEIHAAGDITVWGILGGIAHAGCKGNTKARIRALTLNAIQLRIADSYARRPDHIKNIYVEKSNSFTPEEARNINGSIVILKINDK